MTVNHLMLRKVTTLTDDLGADYWRTVATFDWRDPAKVYAQLEPGHTSAQALALAKTLKAAKKVHVLGYVNVATDLAPGVFAAEWSTRLLRIGTNDDTCLDDHPIIVHPSKAGTNPGAHFATPAWMGTNPGGFHLQVRRPGLLFDSFKAATRFLKVEWLT